MVLVIRVVQNSFEYGFVSLLSTLYSVYNGESFLFVQGVCIVEIFLFNCTDCLHKSSVVYMICLFSDRVPSVEEKSSSKGDERTTGVN